MATAKHLLSEKDVQLNQLIHESRQLAAHAQRSDAQLAQATVYASELKGRVRSLSRH